MRKQPLTRISRCRRSSCSIATAWTGSRCAGSARRSASRRCRCTTTSRTRARCSTASTSGSCCRSQPPAQARTWQAFVRHQALALHRALLAHPQRDPLFATRPAATPAAIRAARSLPPGSARGRIQTVRRLSIVQLVAQLVVGHAMWTTGVEVALIERECATTCQAGRARAHEVEPRSRARARVSTRSFTASSDSLRDVELATGIEPCLRCERTPSSRWTTRASIGRNQTRELALCRRVPLPLGDRCESSGARIRTSIAGSERPALPLDDT